MTLVEGSDDVVKGEEEIVGQKRDRTSNNDVCPAKAEKVELLSAENVCCICMNGDNLLEKHGCVRCSPSAWVICSLCHFQMLSRLCPVCTGNYEPLILTQVPDLPSFPIDFKALSAGMTETDINFITCKISLALNKDNILSSNCGVWSSLESVMYFSLPTGTGQYLVCSLELGNDAVVDGMFEFNNDIWDKLCKQNEEDDYHHIPDEDDGEGEGEGEGAEDNEGEEQIFVNNAVISEISSVENISAIAYNADTNTDNTVAGELIVVDADADDTIAAADTTTADNIVDDEPRNEVQGELEVSILNINTYVMETDGDGAYKWIIANLKKSGSKLMLPLSLNEWNEIDKELRKCYQA